MKTKARFNIIDIILIVILIAAVGAGIFLYKRMNTSEKETVKIRYTVLLTNVKERFKDNITIGDQVVDSVKLMNIGEVVNITPSDSITQLEDYNAGRIVNAVVPGVKDLTVTISAYAVISGNTYLIGGNYPISVGTLVSVRVPDYTSQGYCTSITEETSYDNQG